MTESLNKTLDRLEKDKNKLKHKDIELIVSDFDNTIFSRKEQLNDSKLLRANRGKDGNKIVLEDIGLKKFIDKYYKGKQFPETIIKNMKEHIDLILTAGDYKIQSAKLKATGLNLYNYKVVKSSSQKVLETIRYVVQDIKFIPKLIKVYEDKPDCFIKNKDIIESFLDTRLKVMKVTMKNNLTDPDIQKIKL